MGAIARALANSITTGGVVQASAINNTSVSSVTALPSGADTGDLVLISSQTASSSASIEFTSGLDSTYDSYVFKFINIHASETADFEFQCSTDGGSTYATTITSTYFRALHYEDNTFTNLQYGSLFDEAQTTNFQTLLRVPTANNDNNGSGTLQLFNPSSNTYVKHFISSSNNYVDSTIVYSTNDYVAGYFNTTSAINAIRFQMSSGNIDDGIISLYGVKKS